MVSYKDLVKARVERATKDAEKEAKRIANNAKKFTKAAQLTEAITGKKNRGQKRKSDVLKADPSEPRAKAVRRSKGQVAEAEQDQSGLEPKAPVAGVLKEYVEVCQIAPELWRALVARMW